MTIGNPQGIFSSYDRLSPRMKTGVDDCVAIYHKGGKEAAEIEFRQLAGTHHLVRWEIIALGDTIRTRLKQLGYLPIGSK